MRAWLYCRVANGWDSDASDHLALQKTELEHFCTEHNLTIVGTSMTTGSGENELETLVQNGIAQDSFDVLLTVSASRLSRDIRTALSVSDVVLTEDGAFFCDIIGFKSIDFDESKAHKPDDLLKIVCVEPNRPPFISEVDNDLKSLQRAVDGHMETVYMGDSTILICNEEGKVKGMDCNRRVGDDVIAGSFLIVGEDGEDFRSLTDEEAQRYMERFAQPEQIEQEEVKKDMGFSMHFF